MPATPPIVPVRYCPGKGKVSAVCNAGTCGGTS